MKNQKEIPTEETKKKYDVIEETFDEIDLNTFEKDENTGGYDQVYFVKLKTKDCAYFEFSSKQGETIKVDPRKTIQNIAGKLNKIELGSYTYEKKEIKTIKLYIQTEISGKNCLFIISSSYTQVARSLINALLGCKVPIEKVNITLYINHSGYTSVKFSINGKKSEWKYSIEDMRKHIDTVTNKKGEFVSNDYSDLDNKFEEELQNHLGILFPEQENRRITPEIPVNDILGDEATFGENEEEDFFEIDDGSEREVVVSNGSRKNHK